MKQRFDAAATERETHATFSFDPLGVDGLARRLRLVCRRPQNSAAHGAGRHLGAQGAAELQPVDG
jgi:hypothetical protein